MTDWKTDMRPAFSGLAAILALLMLASGPAAAQLGPPVSDEPVDATDEGMPDGMMGEDAATGAPMNILPGPKVPPPDAPAPRTAQPSGAPGDPADGGVQIGALEQPDPSTIGLLDERNGGYGWDLWQGSDYAVVATLMQQLPAAQKSPVLQDLSERLLLTSAALPTMREDGADDLPSLLNIRLDRLSASGRLTQSAELLQRIPPFSVSADLEQRRADIALLSGDRDSACTLAETAIQRSGAPYWLRLAAFCQAEADDIDRAGRTLDLLAETGASDPLYDTLLGKMFSGDATAPEGMTMQEMTPLTFSMLGALGVPLNAEVLLTSQPMLLAAVAGADNAAPVVRLEALEQVVALGGASLADLRVAYQDVAFDETDRNNALARTAEGGGAELNALLYQMALNAESAASRLEYLAASWQLARRQGQYALIARLTGDLTRAIEPATEHLANAGEVVRALLLSGNVDRAAEWYQVVRQAAAGDDIAATGTLLDIWPLFHLAARDSGVPYSDRILDLWWQAQITAVNAERVRRGRMVYGLLESLDYRVPEEFWTELLAEAGRVTDQQPDLTLWRTVLRAGAAGRMGETLLASVVSLGGQGLEVPSMAAVSSIIGQLRLLGLAAEADRIALETAILRGL